MSDTHAALFIIVLDLVMIFYTLWILRRAGASPRLRFGLGLGALIWLTTLHVILANQLLLPANISGPAFLIVIFTFVGVVGGLLAVTPVRGLIGRLAQEHLLLPQGIRVFFGAGFLMQAALGQLPQTFGILDGFTHVSAGFLGLLAAALCAGAGDSSRHARLSAWIANAFGLIDILVVASTLALVLLDHLTPHHAMMYAVFLPAPIWLWLHVASIWKLLRA